MQQGTGLDDLNPKPPKLCEPCPLPHKGPLSLVLRWQGHSRWQSLGSPARTPVPEAATAGRMHRHPGGGIFIR